jgi:hypothetical protein
LYFRKDLKTQTITTRIVYKKGFKNTNNNDKVGDKMRSLGFNPFEVLVF